MSTQMQQLNDVQRLEAAGIPNVIAQTMSEDNLQTLVVRSDMEALLQEGDIIVYAPQSWIEDSEVALMRLNGSVTLRRVFFCHNEGKASLQPLDPRIAPAIADLNALEVLGRMMAVVRKVTPLGNGTIDEIDGIENALRSAATLLEALRLDNGVSRILGSQEREIYRAVEDLVKGALDRSDKESDDELAT